MLTRNQGLDRADNGRADRDRTVVITGIGMISSLGGSREAIWHAVRHGRSGVRDVRGWPELPPFLPIAAPVSLGRSLQHHLKVIELCRIAASEAIEDAGVDFQATCRDRFGCAISAHMGDTRYTVERLGHGGDHAEAEPFWWQQWLPNTACATIAREHDLRGPRICHSTACASGIVDVLAAARAIQDDQCDLALAGGGEAIHPLLAAGFARMRVLAHHDDPPKACRPFDRQRQGFVMGEGAGMLVLESLEHARRRGARIYAELLAGQMMAEGRHVTDLDEQSEALTQLIVTTLRRGHIRPQEVHYINAHGTGTRQNDLVEARGIHQALGRAAESTRVSATKSMLGHLLNAAGSVELAITILALRDGYLPPTLNLTDPDPACNLDCIPLVGRRVFAEHALKLSIAFGGHLTAVLLRRWHGREARGAVTSKPCAA